jgi:hypothetical protein
MLNNELPKGGPKPPGRTGSKGAVGGYSLKTTFLDDTFFRSLTITQIAPVRAKAALRPLMREPLLKNEFGVPMKLQSQMFNQSQMRLMRTAVAIALALFSATAARGQSTTKYAISGRPLKLSFFSTTNPDCSSVGRPTIRLTRAPEHGRVTVTQTTDFPSFPVSNVRSQCNRRRVAGAALYYVSQRGYVGPDYVQAEIIFASGNLRQVSYAINVR